MSSSSSDVRLRFSIPARARAARPRRPRPPRPRRAALPRPHRAPPRRGPDARARRLRRCGARRGAQRTHAPGLRLGPQRQDLYVGPFPLFIINASYARARAHTRPHTPKQGDPLVQADRAPHTEHSRGGDRPCRPRPVRNVVRCESFLKVSGSVLLSDVPPPQREAQTPASAGRR
jgi:hypothetical protein